MDGLVLVFTTPIRGREEEFHAWYERHVREAVQLSGWRSAQRFAKDAGQHETPYEHVAIYEIDDNGTARAALDDARRVRDAAGNPPSAFLYSSDAKEPDKQMTWWIPIGDPVTSPEHGTSAK